MPKFFAVPYLNDQLVKIYGASGALAGTIALTRPGVNAVVPFSNPSANVHYLFVSYDEHNTAGSATSHIDIYDITNIATPTLKTSLTLHDAVCGMAVQPGTMDLYVATFTDEVTDGGSTATYPGGVFSFTHASGYTTGKFGKAANGYDMPFASYNDAWNAVASVCANLAFDPHGNLWMTTYQSGSSDPANHFLICFTQVDNSPASSKYFFKLTNPANPAVPVTPLPGSTSAVQTPLQPLSEPHGLAFDPLGNLWMANNSDDSNVNGVNGGGAANGTMLRLERNWIDTNLLTNATALASLTADGYGGKQPIPNAPGVTLYGFADGRFGGLSFDGFTLYISDQSAAVAFHQVIWQLNTQNLPANTAPTAAQFTASGLPTTYPGNTTIAIFNSTPAKLLIRESLADAGVEPDTAYNCWESVDIGVVNAALSGLPAPNAPSPTNFDLTSDGSITGGTAFVYVRVANIGGAGAPTTTGTEVLKLYWAKASAGLDWPAPWDGLQFDPNSTPAQILPSGGLIGAQLLGSIDPGHETVFQIPWNNVPNTTLYSINDGHFCLIARVEREALYPFGLDYPEEVGTFSVENENSVGDNVRNNSPIGWRNIAILPPQPKIGPLPPPIHLGVLGANHVPRSRIVHFAVETLNRHGLPTHIPGHVTLQAVGHSRDRLLEKTPEGHAGHHLGDGRFALHDLRIRMHPHEVLPFHVEFQPSSTVHDFAVRVMQYAETRRGPKLLGGQTFVIGKVHGLNAR